MHTWGTWWMAALVATAIAGCPDTHPPEDDGAIDARASVDAGRDDGGMDAARAIDDAGTDAPLDAGTDAHDAAVLGDTNADGALFCPTAGGCTLPSGTAGHCCGGVCSDWATDPTNCGACGGVCGPDLRCRQGRCEHPSCVGVVSSGTAASTARLCPLADGSFGTCCDGVCRSDADLGSDPANCGGCGRICPDGTCGGGECGGVSPHCGAGSGATCPAGTSCQYFGAACERSTCTGAADGSVCSLTSGHDGVCCSGACVDAARDPSNCGACGRVCPAGTACAGECLAPPPCGTPDRILMGCVLPSGGVGSCCGNECVDTTSDAMNCRECAVACPTGSTCDGGYLCVTPLGDGGIQPVHCTTSADCPEHFHCLPGLPTAYCGRDDCAGVPDGTSCGAEGVRVGICCGGECVDSWSDPNCGACGRACPSGVCTIITYLGGGPVVTCLPDVMNTTDCGGAGGCPAGESCVGGVCVLRICPDQGPLCVTASGAAGRCCGAGACTDVSTDPRNCGDCITHCSTGDTCVRGRCVPP